MDRIEGYLEVGTTGHGEVVINHSDVRLDTEGVGHIVFSPSQARNLGQLLKSKAQDALKESSRAAFTPAMEPCPHCESSVRLTPRERYRCDPVFKQLVDMMLHALHSSQFTASEIREAALLAAQEDAATRVNPIMLPRDIFGVDGAV